jgi:Helix-turn-helix domain
MTPLTDDQITPQAIQLATASGILLPEWCDARGAKVIFGFSRSHLYQLVADGKIKSACIRRKGSLRGRRLFNCESIRAFLNANIVE